MKEKKWKRVQNKVRRKGRKKEKLNVKVVIMCVGSVAAPLFAHKLTQK